MDNTSNNNPQNIIDMQNKPRLRKIKRPKQHNGPIRPDQPQKNPPNTQGLHRATPAVENGGYTNGGSLVKAENKEVYTQGFNNYAAVNFTEENTEDEAYAYQDSQDYAYHADNNKKLLFISCICIIIGLILGKFMFNGETVVRDGLQGVIVNPEVPKGRSRCGIAEKTQGCVLYIMNPQRNELNGRDFYDLAAQLTGRQRFVIETGNMRYSTIKIKPGNIAQLNIPPLQ
jgi:hypothetical protein